VSQVTHRGDPIAADANVDIRGIGLNAVVYLPAAHDQVERGMRRVAAAHCEQQRERRKKSSHREQFNDKFARPMPNAFLNSSRPRAGNLFDVRDLAAQRAFFAARPDFAATPLHRCGSLARHLGVAELLFKDESSRLGLNAFKATGALFAVATLVERGTVRRGDTLVCASEGNHGRAVARAARDAGCRACVFMATSVAHARVQAIQSEGAEVRLIDGTYDDAVRRMAEEAERHGWVIVSDTSWPGYTEIPRLIMLGYTRILDEILASESRRPDIIFVPAGVGGLLAAVACWCDLEYGEQKPQVVAVEPLSAACVQSSVRAGIPTAVPGPFTTTMGGLRCGEMSPAVFPVVRSLVDAFVAIEDEYAFEAMRLLHRPAPPDPVISCGPSGAAALGGVLALITAPDLRDVKAGLAIDQTSRIVGLVTEGITDPALFEKVMARP
jgi:diaminopropionate ammonia-lyase